MASASSGNESAETGLPQEFRTGDVRLRASERARTGLRLGRWEGSRAKETNRGKSQLSGPAGGAHYKQPGPQARPPRRSGPACRPPVVAVGGGRRTSEAGARDRIPTRGRSAEAGVIRHRSPSVGRKDGVIPAAPRRAPQRRDGRRERNGAARRCTGPGKRGRVHRWAAEWSGSRTCCPPRRGGDAGERREGRERAGRPGDRGAHLGTARSGAEGRGVGAGLGAGASPYVRDLVSIWCHGARMVPWWAP